MSGRSVAWLARLFRVQEVVSSNLTAPTIFQFSICELPISDWKTQTNLPENLVVELRSIVEPLDLAQFFPRPQPLEVELGCGDASFLVEYARRHPGPEFHRR